MPIEPFKSKNVPEFAKKVLVQVLDIEVYLNLLRQLNIQFLIVLFFKSYIVVICPPMFEIVVNACFHLFW